MKQDHWFHWERQATIQPLLMCMEAWMEPMKKEYGRSWPTTTLIYNKDIVSWYNTWPDLLGYGKYLISLLMEEGEQEKLKNGIESRAASLEGMFSKFDVLSLPLLTDAELLKTYDEFHSAWVSWFVPGGLVEPVGHEGERMVRELLRGVAEKDNEEYFTMLTTTTSGSFSRRELSDLLEIGAAKERGEDVRPLLKSHSKKYFWLHNNYFTTEVLDEAFFENELALALGKYRPQEQLEKMRRESVEFPRKKASLVAQLGLDGSGKSLVSLLDMFAWFQDYRKEYIMRMLHYLDLLLSEMGRRKGFTLREMKYALSGEIPLLMEGRMGRGLLRERMERALFHYDRESGKLEHGTGAWSVEKEKEILHSLTREDDVLEVTGMVANKGFARGFARVTMSAKEAKDIQEGEILVTSMTTPDFVTAMKRAAAVVTNEGGILSHAAVVSREFNIPCIVGTKLATRIFKTGDLIEVDCELGVVRKVSE